MKEKLLWIDIVKGIGIISVVVGHIFYTPYIYAFHMPLFFIIGGFLFSQKEIRFYFKSKLRHLLLPYLTFLLIFSVPDTLKYLSINNYEAIYHGVINNLLWGGEKLHGIKGVFWFVTVFFCTQQVFNFIIQLRMRKRYWMLILLIAYLIDYFDLSLPFNIQVVPMALIFFGIGFYLKRFQINNYSSNLFILSSLLFLFLMIYFCVYVSWNMKHAQYGLPIVPIITATFFCISLAILSYRLTIINKWEGVKKHLSQIGTASMSIMFIHQFVHFFMARYLDINPFLILFFSIYIPFVFHVIISKTNPFLRLVFLGYK